MARGIEKAGEYIYRVESDTSADKKYIVDLTPDDPPSCTCVAFAIQRNRTGRGQCKHINRAVDFSHQVAHDEILAQEEAAELDAAKAGLLATLSDLKGLS